MAEKKGLSYTKTDNSVDTVSIIGIHVSDRYFSHIGTGLAEKDIEGYRVISTTDGSILDVGSGEFNGEIDTADFYDMEYTCAKLYCGVPLENDALRCDKSGRLILSQGDTINITESDLQLICSMWPVIDIQQEGMFNRFTAEAQIREHTLDRSSYEKYKVKKKGSRSRICVKLGIKNSFDGKCIDCDSNQVADIDTLEIMHPQLLRMEISNTHYIADDTSIFPIKSSVLYTYQNELTTIRRSVLHCLGNGKYIVGYKYVSDRKYKTLKIVDKAELINKELRQNGYMYGGITALKLSSGDVIAKIHTNIGFVYELLRKEDVCTEKSGAVKAMENLLIKQRMLGDDVYYIADEDGNVGSICGRHISALRILKGSTFCAEEIADSVEIIESIIMEEGSSFECCYNLYTKHCTIKKVELHGKEAYDTAIYLIEQCDRVEQITAGSDISPETAEHIKFVWDGCDRSKKHEIMIMEAV